MTPHIVELQENSDVFSVWRLGTPNDAALQHDMETTQAFLASRRDRRRAVNFAPQAKRHMGPKLFAEASPVI